MNRNTVFIAKIFIKEKHTLQITEVENEEQNHTTIRLFGHGVGLIFLPIYGMLGGWGEI